MASASNCRQSRTQGVNAMPDSFYSTQGLTDTALWRNVLLLYEHLEVPECNDHTSLSTVDASRLLLTDFFHISESEGWVSANSVPMKLLYLAEQEMADLLLIYPKAEVQANCITTKNYIIVVKKFLFELRVLDLCHPEAYARLLRRLSRELRSVPTLESDNLPDNFPDPADYDGCLCEMLKDMEEYNTPEPWGPDGYVYVRRGVDTYVNCLLAAAARAEQFLR